MSDAMNTKKSKGFFPNKEEWAERKWAFLAAIFAAVFGVSCAAGSLAWQQRSEQRSREAAQRLSRFMLEEDATAQSATAEQSDQAAAKTHSTDTESAADSVDQGQVAPAVSAE